MNRGTAIIDLGIGNLANVKRALGGFVTSDVYDIERADKLVLPGVGNFGNVTDAILPLKDAIIDVVEDGKPFLGICLGMQLLFESSEESDGEGLGIFKGSVKRFEDVPVPHIGWNQIYSSRSCALLDGADDGEFFYFVHSYYVKPVDKGLTSAYTDHQKGDSKVRFPAVVSRDNIFGVQFHPEKSSTVGLQMLKRFKGLECV